jgi:hypothetical protein
MALPTPPKLVTITTPKGVRFTVAEAYAPQFQGMINELEAEGYQLNGNTSGGYNPRVIAGTNTPSEHAYGRAIDVNWDQNPRGSSGGTLSPDLAHKVAQKWGMTWGGDWSGQTRDPMHFQIANVPPVDAMPNGTVGPGTGSSTAPVQTGPPASTPGSPSPGNGNGTDLATIFSNRLKELQAQQQAQGTPFSPLGFGLPLAGTDAMLTPLKKAAQNFRTADSTNVDAPAVTQTPFIS